MADPISPKAYVASGASTLAAPIVGLIVYFTKIQPPADVIADMTVVLAAILAFAGAYLAPHFPAPIAVPGGDTVVPVGNDPPVAGAVVARPPAPEAGQGPTQEELRQSIVAPPQAPATIQPPPAPVFPPQPAGPVGAPV